MIPFRRRCFAFAAPGYKNFLSVIDKRTSKRRRKSQTDFLRNSYYLDIATHDSLPMRHFHGCCNSLVSDFSSQLSSLAYLRSLALFSLSLFSIFFVSLFPYLYIDSRIMQKSSFIHPSLLLWPNEPIYLLLV